MCIGRFDGASALTRLSSNVNDEPRLLRLIPHSGTCTPGSERQEVRLDEADEQPVAVGGAEVRGAAALGMPGLRDAARGSGRSRRGAPSIQSSARSASGVTDHVGRDP